MKNLKKWQGILREKYSQYEYMKLQEIIKNDINFLIIIFDICRYFKKTGIWRNPGDWMISDFGEAIKRDFTFRSFLIEYDYELEILGEEYLISIGAI